MKIKNFIVIFMVSSLALINSVSAWGDESVASSDEMAAVENVVEDWMVPIYPDELNEGVYEIDVASSSSMFRTSGIT